MKPPVLTPSVVALATIAFMAALVAMIHFL